MKYEWKKITTDAFSDTEILNLGCTYLIRVVHWDYEGNTVAASSTIEIDCESGRLIMEDLEQKEKQK